MKNLILLLVAALFCMCSTSTPPPCDETTIVLQPFDKFSDAEVLHLQQDMQQHFFPLVKTKIHIKVLKPKKLPKDCLNTAKTRYSADKCLDYLKEQKDEGILIGLTHSDISTAVHGYSDYGILGYASLQNDVCMVSDHRVRNKHDLWKVVCHEFIHAYYNYGHCPNDDPTCIIKDAKGKENLPLKYHLCETCSKKLNGM